MLFMATEGELQGAHSVHGLYTVENDKTMWQVWQALWQSGPCTEGGHVVLCLTDV